MKKHLSKELTLYFLPTFPRRFRKKGFKEPVIIGVGGNVGNVTRRFKKVALMLAKNPSLQLVATAPLLKNPPFGFTDQPQFYNTLFLVRTSLSPRMLMKRLLYIEKRFKRKRTFKNAPRTLDLDIIFYSDRKMRSKDVTIPHPRWMERESVIIPLKFLGEG